MSKKEDIRRENTNIVILGLFGLVIFMVLRIPQYFDNFPFDLPISEDNDLIMYGFWSMLVLIFSLLLPGDILMDTVTPKLIVALAFSWIAGFIFGAISLDLGNEFFKTIDLFIVSIGTMMISLVKSNSV